MKYSFADYNITIENRFNRIIKQCVGYEKDFESSDLTVSLSDADFVSEHEISDSDYSDSYIETIGVYRKIAEWLPTKDAFLLHSAVIDVDGVGIAFAAHSGTGKTTHMGLWQELLGWRMTVVNGDKPIVRFFDSEPTVPYAYGTPWNGKEQLGTNMRTPVRHICFIERAEENSCEPMNTADAVDLIFNQVYMPKNPIAIMNTMGLINRFIGGCKLWKIKCNMDISAAKTAYEAIFGK